MTNIADAVHYRLIPQDPHAHLFRVSCTVTHPAATGQFFVLPTWIPGSYLIREFARQIVKVWGEDQQGAPLTLRKTAKATWLCIPGAGPVTLHWEVYAFDLSVRTAYLDDQRGYCNGAALFPQAIGQDHLPCLLDIFPPPGKESWQLATALKSEGALPWGFGRYRAEDYDELIDHPMEMGTFTIVPFLATEVPHYLVVSGRHQGDLRRLAEDLAVICQHHIEFFGKPAPMDRYLFLLAVVGDGYGGLEHRASTSLIASRNSLPRLGQTDPSDDYRRLLGLCSHEYFHTWNVKRIRPQAFVPYDLSREALTRLLWVFEGITSYYDDLGLVRSGLLSVDSYLELLGQTITQVWRTPGRRYQSLEDSSFDAWIKFYRPDENTPNAGISYYAKGALVALALDLLLRQYGGSLDEVMVLLWQRYGQTGIGLPEDGMETLVLEQATRWGRDDSEELAAQLRIFFDDGLRGTVDLPLATLLATVGIRLQFRAAESESDGGGKPGNKTTPRPWLGVRWAGVTESEAKLATVYAGGPAERAGLAAGDVLVVLDGLRLTRANVEGQLAALAVGQVIHCGGFRRDEWLEWQITLEAPPEDIAFLLVDSTIDPLVRQRQIHWLKQTPTITG